MVFLSSSREKRIGTQKRRVAKCSKWVIWFVVLIVLLFFQISYANETFRYSIVSRDMVLGEMIYEVEARNQELIYRSFFIVNPDEEPQKDIELVINREDFSPLLSKKWLKISEGEILLETHYTDKIVDVTIMSPYGEKKVSLVVAQPIYDMEQMFFLPTLERTGNFQNRHFSVFVPASGMIWIGRMMKIGEDEKSVKIKYTLAGEILYLNYEKDEPFRLLSMEAPNRGYDLVLLEEMK